jgi:hypothetical protein
MARTIVEKLARDEAAAAGERRRPATGRDWISASDTASGRAFA